MRCTFLLFLIMTAMLASCTAAQTGITPAPPAPPAAPATATIQTDASPAAEVAPADTPAGWIRHQFGDAWDIAHPAGWTVNAAGAHEGAIQLTGEHEGHSYQVSFSYPVGILVQSLDGWVEEQLAPLPPEQRSAVEISDVTVAGAPAKQVLNLPPTGGPAPVHAVYIWRTDGKNPRLITITQVDEKPVDTPAQARLLGQFMSAVRP